MSGPKIPGRWRQWLTQWSGPEGPGAGAVAFSYMVLGLGWVLLADSAISTLILNQQAPTWLMAAKSIGLILCSAALLFGLLSGAQQRRARDQQEIDHLRGELEFVSRSAGAARWQLLTAPADRRGAVVQGKLYPSRAVCLMIGLSYSPGGQSARRWLKRIAAHDLRHLISQAQACLSGTRRSFDIDLQVRRSDRQLRWIRCRGRLQTPDAGRGMIWSGVVTDVTDEHEAVAQLRSFGKLFESSRDGIAVISHDGAIRSHNNAFTRITGLLTEEGDQAHLESLGLKPVQEASFEDVLRKATARGTWLGKMQLRRGKQDVQLTGRMTPVTDDSDRLSHLVLVLYEEGSPEASAAKVRELAAADPLTGLAPLARFLDHAAQCTRRLERPEMATLASVRISRLREINAFHGPAAGDLLLREIARRLQHCGAELVGRASGGRFCLLQSAPWQDAQRVSWARQIRRALEAPVVLEGHRIYPSARIGLAVHAKERSLTETLRQAEGAADFTEASRGADPALFGEIVQSQLAKSHRQEQALRRALELRELGCHFQPIMELSNRSLHACESLLRWRHKDRWVSPYEFVPVAERSGMMPEIGQWILWAAVRRTAQWQREGRLPPDFRLSVNVSATQFGTHWAAQTLATLKRAQLAPNHLTIEISDPGAAEDQAALIRQLAQLRGAGVRICLDDFGVGPAAVSLLQELPLDSLKIGRNFLRQCPGSEKANQLLAAILQMARSHQIETYAVGIENTEQCRFLLEHGCHLGQGYWFSEPLEAGDFEQAFLHRGTGQTATRQISGETGS